MKKGTTLIELIVIIGLLALFIVVILPGMKRLTPEQQLEQAAMDLKSAIFEARAYSFSPKVQYAGTVWYRVEIYKDTREVKIFRLNANLQPIAEIVSSRRKLPKNLDYSKLRDLEKAYFRLGKNLINTDFDDSKNTDLVIVGGNHCLTLGVDRITGRPQSRIFPIGDPKCI